MKNVCSLCSLLWWMWGMVKCVYMRARVADGLWLFWCTIFLHLNIYVAEPMAQTIYIHMYMCNNWIPCIFLSFAKRAILNQTVGQGIFLIVVVVDVADVALYKIFSYLKLFAYSFLSALSYFLSLSQFPTHFFLSLFCWDLLFMCRLWNDTNVHDDDCAAADWHKRDKVLPLQL